MQSRIQVYMNHHMIKSILMSLILLGLISNSEATLPSEKVELTAIEKPKMCSIILNKVSVLKRKLNYQYWDSIEEPAPELFAKIMVNRKQVFYHLLATESYEYSGQLTSTAFPCKWLAKRLHISIFDKDKSHSMEIVGEMTSRVRKIDGDLERILSGGAVRQLHMSVKVLEDTQEEPPSEISPQSNK